jgi:hypothetical protein
MPSPKEETEELMNSLVPFAKDMLKRHREFFPFAGFMAPDGKIAHGGGKIEGTDRPKSQELINLFLKDFRESAAKGEVKAVSIVFDVRIKPPNSSEKTDAIQVCLEHMDGYAADVFFPYRIEKDDVIFGSVFAQRRDLQVFVAWPVVGE